MAGIHRVTGIALLVSLVILLPILIIPLISAPFVISLFNQSPDIIAFGSAYLSVALWSYPAIMLNCVVSATLRSTECVNLPMIVSGATTVANAGLNYVFIFGLGSFIPAMGVKGAALATVISSWLGPILLILCSVASNTALKACAKQEQRQTELSKHF
jgi:Na+-driven multidrug efflux pump